MHGEFYAVHDCVRTEDLSAEIGRKLANEAIKNAVEKAKEKRRKEK